MQSQLAYWKQKLIGMPEALELPIRSAPSASSEHLGREAFFENTEAVDRHFARDRAGRESLTVHDAARGAGKFSCIVTPDRTTSSSALPLPIATGQSLKAWWASSSTLSDPAHEIFRAIPVFASYCGACARRPLKLSRIKNSRSSVWSKCCNQRAEHEPQSALSNRLHPGKLAALRLSRDRPHFRSAPARTARPELDLTLDLWEEPDGIGGWLEYDTDLFDASTAARMVAITSICSSALRAEPGQPISHYSLLSDADRQRILVEWNATARDYELDSAFRDLFEAQVERTPNAVAVVYGPMQLNYAELNQRANSLARLLVEQGVGAESVVGLLMRRDINLLISILAVLKAGGAYLPLDPIIPCKDIARSWGRVGRVWVYARASFYRC